jgi:homoprotocatechuate degradation regulator HpaR
MLTSLAGGVKTGWPIHIVAGPGKIFHMVHMQAPSKPRHTRRSLPMALLRARESVMEDFRPMLNRHGVTEQQWRVIRVLAEAGELDATEVSVRASLLAPSLTRMIRTLEDRKLIKRKSDKSDGRRVILQIAADGKNLIQEVIPESSAIYQSLEEKFGKQKLNTLLDLLDELIALK